MTQETRLVKREDPPMSCSSGQEARVRFVNVSTGSASHVSQHAILASLAVLFQTDSFDSRSLPYRTMWYQLLADLVLLVHIAFIGFVLFGGLLALKWQPVMW